MNDVKKYPEGHFVGIWLGIGMAIFAGFGVPLSIATGNFGLLALGPAIGCGVGVSVGSAIEKKRKEQGLIRPLTEAEKNQRRFIVMLGSIVLLVGVAVLLAFLLW